MSYKVAVKVYGEPNWSYNAQRFATKQEADDAANELMGRWMSVEKYEVQDSTDPVNYHFANGQAVRIETPEPAPAPEPVASVPEPASEPDWVPDQEYDNEVEVEAQANLEEPETVLEPPEEPKRKRKAKSTKPKKKAGTFADGSSMAGIYPSSKEIQDLIRGGM